MSLARRPSRLEVLYPVLVGCLAVGAYVGPGSYGVYLAVIILTLPVGVLLPLLTFMAYVVLAAVSDVALDEDAPWFLQAAGVLIAVGLAAGNLMLLRVLVHAWRLSAARRAEEPGHVPATRGPGA